MLSVQVSRWSQAAVSLIPPEQEVIGWIHSRYARMINVRTPGGRLLTVQGEGMLQAPLGLTLATTPPHPHLGATASAQGRQALPPMLRGRSRKICVQELSQSATGEIPYSSARQSARSCPRRLVAAPS